VKSPKIPKFNVALFFAEGDKTATEINFNYQLIFKITDYYCEEEERKKIVQVVRILSAPDYQNLQALITEKSQGLYPFVSFELLQELYSFYKKCLTELVKNDIIVFHKSKWILKESNLLSSFPIGNKEIS